MDKKYISAGDVFIRLLKKDGTVGKKIEKLSGWRDESVASRGEEVREILMELDRVREEYRRIEEYDGPDKWGALMASADWRIEEILMERDRLQAYRKFLERKQQYGEFSGFDPVWMPDFLFDFQKHLVDWNCRKGRSATLADCGLGKTPMLLVWAENVVRKTGTRVLILTPLAVAAQTVAEGEKFGIEVTRSRDGKVGGAGIYVTNYERLHHFDPNDFIGLVCDESSAIKNFNGKRKAEVTEFMRKLPYRLLCTATAAPNDYVELGTSSEALGELGYMDMLARFFKNDQNTCDTKTLHRRPPSHGGPKAAGWRFKGHAEIPFFQWVCSWARACRKPSDLGFSDERFVLPELIEREHIVEARTLADGMLLSLPATNMKEEREERRRTITERCEKAAELVIGTGEPAVLWCHLNPEGDLLKRLIPGSEQISGSTPDDRKEEIYEAFASGQLKDLITKPKIGAWGLNWQHCAHVVPFSSHSYEQYYQAVRRCWRFGQKRKVTVDLIATEGERGAKENMQRKSANTDRMFTMLVEHMNDALSLDRSVKYEKEVQVPSWI